MKLEGERGQRQHFVPEFLLKKWAGSDGKVGIFRKDLPGLPYSRRGPKHTGYERGLYSFRGVKETETNLTEKHILMPIDDMAAKIFDKLLRSASAIPSDEDFQWILLFVGSMEMRNSQRLKMVEGFVNTTIAEEIESGSKLSDEAKKLQELFESRPELLHNMPLKYLGLNIEHVAQRLQSEIPYFGLRSFEGLTNHLLLSDTPYIRTEGIWNPGVVLVLPISPWKAIMGFRTKETEQHFARISRRELLSRINEASFSQAAKRIYTRDQTPRCFLEKRLKKLNREAHD